MAPTLPVPNTLRLDLFFSIGGDLDVQSRTFWAYTGVCDNAAALALATAASAPVFTDLQPLIQADSAATGVKVTDLSSTSGGVGENLFSASGSRSGELLSAATSALIDYQIARRYRGGKPRNYLPFGSGSDLLTRDTWNSTALTAFTTGWTAFLAVVKAFTGSGLTIADQVNVSYADGFTNVSYGSPTKYRRVPIPRDPPITDTITGWNFAPTLSSQRRRIPR